MPKLPKFIPPMLAQIGEPFDSRNHLFEIKWDGTRALTFIEDGKFRMINRRRIDMNDRYPDFAFLAELDPGTVLDGEMVVLKDGKPVFNLLQSREQVRSALKIRMLARTMPATYIVFDLLYHRFEPLLDQPLKKRRLELEKLVASWNRPNLLLSQGLIGPGKSMFKEACQQGLEGIMAKKLTSKYLPGQRTDAWIKIKRHLELYCAIIGFIPSGKDDFRSLILATEENGKLTFAGKVGTGFNNALRKNLNHWLWSHLRPKPIIPCTLPGKWVEPGLVCRVSCMERTEKGELRAPAFEELVSGE